MKEFFAYFFGQGTAPEFALFTPAHFAPVVMAAVVIYVLFRSREKLRVWQHEEKLRYLMAFALIITDMSYYWRLAAIPALGGNAVDNRDYANEQNEALHLTVQQVSAMENGVIYGWDTPVANPKYYDENGHFYIPVEEPKERRR